MDGWMAAALPVTLPLRRDETRQFNTMRSRVVWVTRI